MRRQNTRLLPPGRAGSAAITVRPARRLPVSMARSVSNSASLMRRRPRLEFRSRSQATGGGRDAQHPRRQMRLLEHIDEIVDENIEIEACETVDLGGEGVLEIDAVEVQWRIRGPDQAGFPHPVARGCPQVGTIGVLMAVLGLVADNVEVGACLPAGGEERGHTGEHHGVLDALAVNPSLQALPGQLSAGFGAQMVA